MPINNKQVCYYCNKGFTLVELLVVVGIIAILSVIAITIYSSTLQSSRDSKRTQDIQSITKALEARYDAVTGEYPELKADWFIAPESQTPAVPADPLNGESSCYNESLCKYCFNPTGSSCAESDLTTFSGGSTFKICANLESNKVISAGVYCISNQR